MADISLGVPPDVLASRIKSFQDWGQQNGFDALVVFGQGSVLGTARGATAISAIFSIGMGMQRHRPSYCLPQGCQVWSLLTSSRKCADANANYCRTFGLAGALRLPQRSPISSLRAQSALRLQDGMKFRSPFGSRLLPTAPRHGLPADAELAIRRAIKDGLQVAFHRRAAAICDLMFEQLGPALHSGLTVADIQAELEKIGRQHGCEYCDTWLTVRPIADRCRYLAEENANVPQPGDQVLLGIMLILHGHWGHAIRTGSLGTPSAAANDVFKSSKTCTPACSSIYSPARICAT